MNYITSDHINIKYITSDHININYITSDHINFTTLLMCFSYPAIWKIKMMVKGVQAAIHTKMMSNSFMATAFSVWNKIEQDTVRLGYNELGYNEHLVITNRY